MESAPLRLCINDPLPPGNLAIRKIRNTGTIDTGTIDTGTIDTGTIDTGMIYSGRTHNRWDVRFTQGPLRWNERTMP